MSNDIVPVNQNTGLPAVPDYLRVENDQSADSLKGYVRPPRIKVIQSLTDQKLREDFGIGSVILLPQNVCILEMPRDDKGNPLVDTAEPFIFTPLFFFPEFCVWNPLEEKGNVPAIRDRSFDPNSDIARRARDYKARSVPYEGNPEYKINYVEHLNFIVAVDGIEDACVLSFSKAEFSAGQNFAASIKMRSQAGCPLYGGVYAANLAHRVNNKGDWYGLDISNPPEGIAPFVPPANFEQYKGMYEEFRGQHENSKIVVDYEDPAQPEASASDSASTI